MFWVQLHFDFLEGVWVDSTKVKRVYHRGRPKKDVVVSVNTISGRSVDIHLHKSYYSDNGNDFYNKPETSNCRHCRYFVPEAEAVKVRKEALKYGFYRNRFSVDIQGLCLWSSHPKILTKVREGKVKPCVFSLQTFKCKNL